MQISTNHVGPSAFALIIGISSYQDERIRPLEYTHADAQAVAQLLTDPTRCRIPPAQTRVLLDREATLFNIKHSISGWLHQHAMEESTVFIFFAGHGGVESDRTGLEPDNIAKYLLPWDANADNLFASALANTELHRLLNTIRAQRLVLFMDACYSGGVAERGARDLGIVGNPYERLAEGQGRLVIAASKPNQRSWEDTSLGHGIFTHHLLEALSGSADTDEDGYVSIMEVYKYLEQNVPRSARKLAKGDQVPLWTGSLTSDIVLTVDSERIAALKSKKKEKEQKKLEELRRKRRALFQLYEENRLPTDAYNDSVRLIEQSKESLSDRDDKRLDLVEGLISGGLTPELFLQMRELLLSSEDSSGESGGRSTNPPSIHVDVGRPAWARDRVEDVGKSMPPAKFCISCGTRLQEHMAFCVGCGRHLHA